MKKKLVASLLIGGLLMTSAPCMAQTFQSFGQGPIKVMEYEPYDKVLQEGSDIILTDPFDNEFFDIIGEMSEDEYIDLIYYYENETEELFPYSARQGMGEEKYNDGIVFRWEKMYDEDYGEDSTFPVYRDADGNIVLYGLAAGWQRTWEYGMYYNFGYFIESCSEVNPYVEPFEVCYAHSQMTNAVTGQTYLFEDIVMDKIDQNGVVYFYTLSPGTDESKYYKAQLKKSAIVTVSLNGEKLRFDQIPVIENGRTLVPLRAIFEALGASVEWNADTQTVTAQKDGTEVSLTIDSPIASKNGEDIALDTAAKIENGRTLVPVRFIADSFGVNIEWDGEMQRVSLSTY